MCECVSVLPQLGHSNRRVCLSLFVYLGVLFVRAQIERFVSGLIFSRVHCDDNCRHTGRDAVCVSVYV